MKNLEVVLKALKNMNVVNGTAKNEAANDSVPVAQVVNPVAATAAPFGETDEAMAKRLQREENNTGAVPATNP